MDHHVPAAITDGLWRHGIDVLTAGEDGLAQADDRAILARAAELGRIVFTSDKDFLVIAREAQESGLEFGGIVYGHQLQVTIGEAIRDLELICTILTPDEIRNQIHFLPI
jgi:hypothetical protein